MKSQCIDNTSPNRLNTATATQGLYIPFSQIDITPGTVSHFRDFMENEEMMKKGTTTVGLLCVDGVILASEKRASMGTLIANKEVDKVLKIQDHLAITIAGSVGDAQTIARILKAHCALYEIQRGKRITIEGAGTLLANVLQGSKYFPYWIQILMGGYDTVPRLFSLDLTGSLLTEKFVATGSGSPVAYGVFEDKYKENKTIKDNLPLAIKALKAAMERDVMSGNGISVVIIDKQGFRKLTDEEIDALK
jgi:proteasome beta subunit